MSVCLNLSYLRQLFETLPLREILFVCLVYWENARERTFTHCGTDEKNYLHNLKRNTTQKTMKRAIIPVIRKFLKHSIKQSDKKTDAWK